jgi:DNA-3-methyladenine glycosylase II
MAVSTSKSNWSAAVRHLRKVDPVMKGLIDKVGPCRLEPRRDYFVMLANAIVSQQISTKVAEVLFNRFKDQFPRRKPTPELTTRFLAGEEALVRACGLSRQKHGYLIDLSLHFTTGKIPVRRFARMSDEEVIESLTQVKGIGRWTAEMFLIFVLNRPDVFPVDDLGIQEAYKKFYGLSEPPTPKKLLPLGESWRPWRTVATYYLWRALEDKSPVKA